MARRLASALGVVTLCALMSLGCAGREPLPPPLAASVGAVPAGKVVVVELVDFQCPFCRLQHPIVSALVARHRDRITLVRRHVPLQRHDNALSAARAAVCAEALGAGDAMADALVAAPVDDLALVGTQRLAASLGLPTAAFDACLSDPTTARRIQGDVALFDALGGQGLPLVYVGARPFVGVTDLATLEQAFTDALP